MPSSHAALRARTRVLACHHLPVTLLRHAIAHHSQGPIGEGGHARCPPEHDPCNSTAARIAALARVHVCHAQWLIAGAQRHARVFWRHALSGRRLRPTQGREHDRRGHEGRLLRFAPRDCVCELCRWHCCAHVSQHRDDAIKRSLYHRFRLFSNPLHATASLDALGPQTSFPERSCMRMSCGGGNARRC